MTTEATAHIFGNTGADLACALPGHSGLEILEASRFSTAPWPCGGDSTGPLLDLAASTPRSYYLEAIGNLADQLRREGGKAVIVRTICGEFSRFEPERLAAAYLASIPEALRFLFRCPDGSFWMGASPELLLEDIAPGRCRTRALAGTRTAGAPGPWSEKNKAEHAIVVDDMLGRLREAGLTASASEARNLRYGPIEHLCTDIDIINTHGLPHPVIAALLHPTPAVGGYPRERAAAHISRIELTPRGFYTGTLTVPVPAGFLSYVILRAVHFDSHRWCVYTGSGITADSDAADEWEETQAKAQPLLAALAPYSKPIANDSHE